MQNKKLFGTLVAGAVASLVVSCGGKSAPSLNNDPVKAAGVCTADAACGTSMVKSEVKPEADSCSGKNCAGLDEVKCKATAGCVWKPGT